MRSELRPDDPRHGTCNGYVNLGCRCRQCRDANAAWNRKRREERRALIVAEIDRLERLAAAPPAAPEMEGGQPG